ncbi:radical SAM protein [uncultured Thiodictyon sp.]|uniref:radical SAM protein n=1 Tax=uncultured Thiodictyon sp. TaxID=1846217 RepID=UPI0025DB732C|nr:radical SAM protein [uncultured Thiodictyon sp.]
MTQLDQRAAAPHLRVSPGIQGVALDLHAPTPALGSEIRFGAQPKQSANAGLKDALYRELELHVDLSVQGVNIDPADHAALNALGGGRTFGPTRLDEDLTLQLPSFYLPHGLSAGVRLSPHSVYGLVVEDGEPVLCRYGKRRTLVAKLDYRRKPKSPLAGRVTSDGVSFEDIARIDETTGLVHVSYSKECSLKDKGEECKFCNYDNRNAIVKTPRQVGELFAAAVEAGVASSFHLTGGFIPERRELEHYIDVAEEIKARTGLEGFVGSISMGATEDYTIFDKLKEAGYVMIGSNMEVWDRNFRKAIVPGKENQCGGWDNWVASLEYAVKVFGTTKIVSNIVAGIETKKSILEGVEYLCSRGILGNAGIWRPTPGTDLEGHQTPLASWHLDLAFKRVAIYKKYGFTREQIHSYHGAGGIAGIIYRIEDELFEDGKLKSLYHPRLTLQNQTH